jgi:hypothetical protein
MSHWYLATRRSFITSEFDSEYLGRCYISNKSPHDAYCAGSYIIECVEKKNFPTIKKDIQIKKMSSARKKDR